MLSLKRLGFVCGALLVAMLAMPVLAQDNGGAGGAGGAGGGGGGAGQNGGGGGQGGGGGGGGFGGGGGGRNFDPAARQQMMMQRYQTQLGATDDEMAAIMPKITAIQGLQRDAGQGGMRGMFGRGAGGPGGGGPGGAGFGGGAPTTQPSAAAAALQDLRGTLNDQNASADTIKEKLQVLRDARAKAKMDLAAAQQDLKSLLTQRQEAVLVMMGVLE
jgi:hypothetical protein